MNMDIEKTLCLHYGVTKCRVDELDNGRIVEVYCVGGDPDYVKIGLAQMCGVVEGDISVGNLDDCIVYTVKM